MLYKTFFYLKQPNYISNLRKFTSNKKRSEIFIDYTGSDN